MPIEGQCVLFTEAWHTGIALNQNGNPSEK